MKTSVIDVLLKKCIQVQDGETVLVVTDTLMHEVGHEVYHAIRETGIRASLLSIEPLKTQGEEPPPLAAEALKHCSVALIVTSKSLTHTRARREACEQYGVRVVSMPGTDPGRLERLLDIDYDELLVRCDGLSKLLENGRKVRLKSSRGTNLEMSIERRRILCDSGTLSARGTFGNMPCGEVYVSPVEGTASGVVVIDGSIASLGRLKDPVRIVFKNGYAVDVSDPRLEKMLKAHPQEAANLAEFGIGLNPHAEVVGNILEDEKAMGTAHIGLGDNLSMGGSVRVPFHIDAILLNPEIEVDGQKLPPYFTDRKTETSVFPSEVRPAAGISLERSYKTLFDAVDLPQFVLDYSTQTFIEVNPGFARLVGLPVEDLTNAVCDISKVLTKESYLTYKQKREAAAERFEVKVLTRDGVKVPVELRLKRITLYGREVVVGTMQDLTRAKKVELDMWERIQELGYANNRVYALTEKIRKVPELMPLLLPITNETELLDKASQILCDRQGLAYQAVSFYLLKDQQLVLAHSTAAARTGPAAPVDPAFTRILKGEIPHVINTVNAVLPLRGRDHNLGVIEILFDPKEMEVMKPNERALKGYHDLIETLASQLGLLIENLHLYETIRLQAIIDQLTGLYNRRFLDSKMAEELNRAARYKRELSLLMIDVDHFKEINDTYGHQQGDAVLLELAKILKQYSREVDILCRYGGDELAVLMPETPMVGAMAKAETLRLAVKEHAFANVVNPDETITLTLSVGVASYSREFKTADDFFRKADENLYQAKRDGRNRVVSR